MRLLDDLKHLRFVFTNLKHIERLFIDHHIQRAYPFAVTRYR